MVVVGSNYGTFRVRQDEGGPKWLSDADVTDPAGNQHGGGFGYLFDGPDHLTGTAYTGGVGERTFGIGYATTGCSWPALTLAAKHTVAVLPGDAPSVLVEVTISNSGQFGAAPPVRPPPLIPARCLRPPSPP